MTSNSGREAATRVCKNGSRGRRRRGERRTLGNEGRERKRVNLINWKGTEYI